MDVLWALLLIGLALFVGGFLFRRVPSAWLVIGSIFVVFGFGIPALVTDDNRAETAGEGAAAEEAPAGEGEAEEPAGGEGEQAAGEEEAGGGAAAEGKQLFVQNCGTCHVLQDAGTSGQVGPPLDPLAPDAARVQAAIEKGGTGSGTMPANIVTGADAEAVAEYVASVAGK